MSSAQPSLPDAVVHVLVAGFPLCGFSMQPPTKWPQEHSWVHEAEAVEATCERCCEEVSK